MKLRHLLTCDHWTLVIVQDNPYIGAATVVALVSLITGVLPRTDISVFGACMHDGAMHGDGHATAAALRYIQQYYGVTSVLLSLRDTAILKQSSPEVFQPNFDGPSVSIHSPHLRCSIIHFIQGRVRSSLT